MRASSTSAALTARFEADSEQALVTIQEVFRTQIARVDPSVELGF